MATLVKFRYNEANKDLFAFFPQLSEHKRFITPEHFKNFKTAYSHVGQHSACAKGYEQESRPATESEYLPLKQELESIGYKLKICK